MQHVDAQGVPDFEVLQDRPLRGKPLLWEHMYRRMGLCPLACADLGEGNCVVKQIALVLKKKSRETVGGSGRPWETQKENILEAEAIGQILASARTPACGRR